MNTIQWNDVRSNPAALLSLVEAGEPVVIVRDGTTVAELRPVPEPRLTPRPYGLCRGQFTVPDDFNDPLPDDILEAFEGR